MKGRKRPRPGAKFEYLDQKGAWHAARNYPVPRATTITSEKASGVVVTPGEPTAGGVIGRTRDGGPDEPRGAAAVVHRQADRRAGRAHEGRPCVGTGTTDRVLHVPLFFQLVDKGTGAVARQPDDPVRVRQRTPEPQSLSFPIEGVSYDVTEADQLVLEVNSNSANYLVQRGGGAFNIEEVSVDLPVVLPRTTQTRERAKRSTRRRSAPGAQLKKKRGSIASSSMSIASPTKSTRA